jgi:hypothetical protein
LTLNLTLWLKRRKILHRRTILHLQDHLVRKDLTMLIQTFQWTSRCHQLKETCLQDLGFHHRDLKDHRDLTMEALLRVALLTEAFHREAFHQDTFLLLLARRLRYLRDHLHHRHHQDHHQDQHLIQFHRCLLFLTSLSWIL